MQAAGIIAEYNPFHNGHSYQLKDIRSSLPVDGIIAVMSGDFTQRGLPAMVDKYVRTEMALRAGVDLVLELPFLYSCGSAELFARGGVSLLEQTKVTGHLCFGSECTDEKAFRLLTDFLTEEPEEYRLILRRLQKQGLSFPAAREQALSSCFADRYPEIDPALLHGLLSSPNSILGLEYFKQLDLQHSSMVPFLTQRTGAGYHEAFPSGPIASATGIRRLLKEAWQSGDWELAQLSSYMPEASAELIGQEALAHRLIFPEQLTPFLNYRLFQGMPQQAAADCDSDLLNRIFRLRDRCTDYEDFVLQVKNKSVTHSHICRALLSLLLGVTREEALLAAASPVPYLRVLGFRRDHSSLLTQIRNQASVPLITKPSDTELLLSREARIIYQADCRAAAFYEMLQRNACGREVRRELEHSPILI